MNHILQNPPGTSLAPIRLWLWRMRSELAALTTFPFMLAPGRFPPLPRITAQPGKHSPTAASAPPAPSP